MSSTLSISAWQRLRSAPEAGVAAAAAGRVPTPIIAFSASVLEEDVKEAFAAGMNGFSSKPVDLYHLTQEIARLLGIAADIKPPERSTPGEDIAPTPVVRGSVIDWQTGRQLWGSEDRHREAIRRFLVDYGEVVPRLRQTLDTPAELASQLHKLKGAAANLALSRTTALCATLERELAAGGAEGVPGLLNQLADELGNVRDALSQLGGEPLPVAPEQEVRDVPRLLEVLQYLDDALARGELSERALAILAELLPGSAYAALDDAINAFDFELARQLATDLRNRYSREGLAP